jgi:hypothetical protein
VGQSLDKIKTARFEGGLFWLTYTCVLFHAASAIHHPNKKDPTFSKEVGFGRRVRGNAIAVNILGGILLEMRNESMIFDNQF